MQYRMSCPKINLYQRLDRVYEIRLGIKGRKSGRDIPRPVWFVHEGNTLYLLPVQGSDTVGITTYLVDPMLKISVNGMEISTKGKSITDDNEVDNIVKKSRI